MEIPDSVRYLNKKPTKSLSSSSTIEQFSHDFSESNTIIKKKPKPSKLRSLKLSKSYTSNLNRKKKNNTTNNFESYCSSESDIDDPENNNHIVPSGNESATTTTATTLTRSHSEYGIVQKMPSSFSQKKHKKSKSTTSSKYNCSSSLSSRSHSKNSSVDLLNNNAASSLPSSPLPNYTPLPKKISVSRLKSSDSSKTNNSSLDSNNYLGIGTCFSTPNNYSYNSSNSNSGHERTRHCSDNSGLSLSCHDKIVKTETKRGSILSRRMFSVSYKAKNSNFHKYFRNIPQSERLLEDYACALVKDILIQGRIYISQNWICFHANILSWETTLQIPVSKVKEVKKASTIRVIPNAILLELYENTDENGTPGHNY